MYPFFIYWIDCWHAVNGIGVVVEGIKLDTVQDLERLQGKVGKMPVYTDKTSPRILNLEADTGYSRTDYPRHMQTRRGD